MINIPFMKYRRNNLLDAEKSDIILELLANNQLKRKYAIYN